MKSKVSHLGDSIDKAVDNVTGSVEKSGKELSKAVEGVAEAAVQTVDEVFDSAVSVAKLARSKATSSIKLARKTFDEASENAGESLHSVVNYLGHGSTRKLVNSTSKLIKRHPLRSVGLGVGLGLLLGKAWRR